MGCLFFQVPGISSFQNVALILFSWLSNRYNFPISANQVLPNKLYRWNYNGVSVLIRKLSLGVAREIANIHEKSKRGFLTPFF